MAESRFLENILPCADTLPCVFDVAHGKYVTIVVCSSHGIAEALPCVFCLPCVSRPGTRQTYALPCAQLYAVCCTFDTRQRRCLPCARNMAHGKGFGTRQLGRFRSAWCSRAAATTRQHQGGAAWLGQRDHRAKATLERDGDAARRRSSRVQRVRSDLLAERRVSVCEGSRKALSWPVHECTRQAALARLGSTAVRCL